MRTEILKELTLYICLTHHPPFDPHPTFTTLPTLISTWLKVLPLCMPTTLPIISGTTIMFRRCVLMQAGFSSSGHSFLALRNLLIKARGFLFNPRENLYRQRHSECMSIKQGLIQQTSVRASQRQRQQVPSLPCNTTVTLSTIYATATQCPLYISDHFQVPCRVGSRLDPRARAVHQAPTTRTRTHLLRALAWKSSMRASVGISRS